MIERVADLIFTEELYLIRKTTLIFSQPWETISEADLVLLDKILQAVKLTRSDVAIIHQPILDLGALSIRPRKAIYFGKPVSGLAPYEVISVEGSSVVLSLSLGELQTDQAAKGKLWAALRAMFGR